MRILLAVLLAFAISGCATLSGENSGKLPTQYATLKLIEQSEDITAEKVTAHVDRVLALVQSDDEIAMIDVRQEALARVDLVGMDASDRLLFLALVDEIEYAVEIDAGQGNWLTPEARARLSEILGWVSQAAAMAD